MGIAGVADSLSEFRSSSIVSYVSVSSHVLSRDDSVLSLSEGMLSQASSPILSVPLSLSLSPS